VFSGLTEKELSERWCSYEDDFSFSVRVRYTAPPERCSVSLLDDGRVRVRFLRKLRIAKGQSAVIYKGGVVMLGGIIED
jgi:tRNA U34 2-thiouridine synthase MnmA/TrmU